MDDIKEPAASQEGEATRVYNRQLLVADIAEKSGLPRGKAVAAVEAMIECIGQALKDGKEVRLMGFGSFNVSERKASKGRDPRTGEEIDVPESKSVRFRPGKVLKDLVAIPGQASAATGE